MYFKVIKTGNLATNCYILGCEETKEAIVIDPGFLHEDIELFLEEEDLKVKYIVNTHGHSDHTAANEDLKRKTDALVLIHEADQDMLVDPESNLSIYLGSKVAGTKADVVLKDGDHINFGSIDLQVLHTPGHTPGGICLLGDNYIISGDTLFAGSVGRTDFPGSSQEDLMRGIHTKLMPLEKNYIIYPGHGPSTTLEQEKANNPFLKGL